MNRAHEVYGCWLQWDASRDVSNSKADILTTKYCKVLKFSKILYYTVIYEIKEPLMV